MFLQRRLFCFIFFPLFQFFYSVAGEDNCPVWHEQKTASQLATLRHNSSVTKDWEKNRDTNTTTSPTPLHRASFELPFFVSAPLSCHPTIMVSLLPFLTELRTKNGVIKTRLPTGFVEHFLLTRHVIFVYMLCVINVAEKTCELQDVFPFRLSSRPHYMCVSRMYSETLV